MDVILICVTLCNYLFACLKLTNFSDAGEQYPNADNERCFHSREVDGCNWISLDFVLLANLNLMLAGFHMRRYCRDVLFNRRQRRVFIVSGLISRGWQVKVRRFKRSRGWLKLRKQKRSIDIHELKFIFLTFVLSFESIELDSKFGLASAYPQFIKSTLISTRVIKCFFDITILPRGIASRTISKYFTIMFIIIWLEFWNVAVLLQSGTPLNTWLCCL